MTNKSSEKVHRATILRRINEWLSTDYLTQIQLEAGVTYRELCKFLFTIYMSRGYEDERLILKVFIMFVSQHSIPNSQKLDIENLKMNMTDLRAFLLCTMFCQDTTILKDYCLVDESATVKQGAI